MWGGGTGSIPGLGTKIPHAARHGQKKKRKRQAWLLAMVSLCLPSQWGRLEGIEEGGAQIKKRWFWYIQDHVGGQIQQLWAICEKELNLYQYYVPSLRFQGSSAMAAHITLTDTKCYQICIFNPRFLFSVFHMMIYLKMEKTWCLLVRDTQVSLRSLGLSDCIGKLVGREKHSVRN